MKLYDAAWAPSPRRVRIYLAEKGIEVERVMIDLRADEHLGDAYLAVNPRGAVPALELDDGEVITESAAICRYFEALHPAPPLFGTSPVEIARIESWTRRVESDGYIAAVYAFRNSIPQLKDRGIAGKWPPIPQIPDLATRGAVMWKAFAEGLDGHLATSEWIAGDAYSFADVTALVTVDFAAKAGLDIHGCGHIGRWHQAASARPSAGA
jgi:glutathione S-transferase